MQGQVEHDACEDEPCIASSCTNLSNEEESTTGRAFACGACWEGYEKEDPSDIDSNCQGGCSYDILKQSSCL